jgi:iron complex transport system permease protein
LNTKHPIFFISLLSVLIIVLLVNLSLGAVSIPIKDVFMRLIGYPTNKESWDYIILNYRLPKAITAILVGFGLSISGLLMQTLFRNPLAGPYVLGLSSGSSLGVAFIILGAGVLPASLTGVLISTYGIMLASCLGSFTVLICVLIISQKLRDTASILIIGLMFGSMTSAIVSILTYFSTAEQLQKFTFWSMGNLSNLSWSSILFLFLSILIGLLLAIFCIKSLDAMLLGENYAKSLGLNYKKSRFVIILATSILTGSITAFAGPIAFVGLAVPHIAKLLLQTSNHKILFWATLLLGGLVMLVCDIFCYIPNTDIMLPINAVTSIIGAPIVIWLMVAKFNFK